ncbi:MAG: XRE family transcriptional regulator, partial [bacterium]|nr:XRE family transcriptional regulator [bacterium]
VRIAAARRDFGLTQEECAERAGLGRSALAKIETGARGVGATELARLADALEMRIEWFFDDAPAAVVSRRNAAEPGAPSPEIDRVAEHVAREVSFLQDIGELDLAATPHLDFPDTLEQAEDAAADTRRQLGYDGPEPAVYLARHAAGIGLLAFSRALGERSADGASILLGRGGVAVVNGSRSVGRRRLTLAHELGHYVFADEYSTDWNVVSAPAGQTESLVDRFARSLLLPAAALRDRWGSGDDTRTSAVLIASEYRVDMTTLAGRLSELELASAEEVATVRATRTRQSDIVEHGLVVAPELAPPYHTDVYVKAVLNVYRREEISAARALALLSDTWDESDLPDLPQLPADAIWSFVS